MILDVFQYEKGQVIQVRFTLMKSNPQKNGWTTFYLLALFMNQWKELTLFSPVPFITDTLHDPHVGLE